MDFNRYKRDYRFKSSEGANGGGINKWIIIIGGILVALAAYFLG